MRVCAVAVALVLAGSGLVACSDSSIGECPEPEVIAAPADAVLALSCALLVTYNGIDYSPSCGSVHPSRVGPVIDELEGDGPRAVRSVVGVDPAHAVIFVGRECGKDLQIAFSDGLTPREEMYLRTPVNATGVARITCLESGATRVETPLVWGRVDGIHLEVDNRTGSRVVLKELDVDAPPGKSRSVSKVSPGRFMVACGDRTAADDLRVKDYAGYWRFSKPLQCASGDEVVVSDDELPIDVKGELGNPVNVISEGLEGMDYPDDRQKVEGWVGDETPVVRVSHMRVPTARFELSPTDEGGWVISRSEICSGSDIRFAP